ncbi:MAG: CoA transferase [Deltaproteobacteria bacterium]|nr:CoA transferase [Deltaproteobacteria bacterium]
MNLDRAPLTGITVVALEHAIAGPLCTKQLADLGARIIKIERPQAGDFARDYDTRTLGQSSHFVWANRGKLSFSLNIKSPEGIEILKRLLKESDVLLQNLAPGAAKRLGLDYSSLHSQFPQLILCDISGYGQTGPYKDKKAYDLLIQAESGLLAVTGTEQNIVKSGISIADIAAGTQANAAILAAIIQRSKVNKGAHIDISMLEAMVEWMGFPLNYAHNGQAQPERKGTEHPTIYPYGLFQCKDKSIVFGIQNEREWNSFCTNILAKDNLVDDIRFASNALRSQNRESLKPLIKEFLLSCTAEEVIKKLDEHKIACAKVNHIDEVWQHEQLRFLKKFALTKSPNGNIETMLPPGNSNLFEPNMGPIPELGEHNKLLLEELGYTDKDIEGFVLSGVV